MKKIFMYLKLEIKRMIKSFPVIFLVTILLTLGFALLVWAQMKADEEEPGKQKINIGIVGDMEDSYLGFGIYALENMDSSRYTIHFVSLSENEAREKLEYGEISVYLRIPEGFVDSIVRGENMPVTFVSGGSQGGIGTELIREMADTVSEIITESQTGIYSLQDIYLKEELTDTLYDAERNLNLQYFDMIFGREKLYEIITLEGDHGLSLTQHFLCAAIVVFFLFWGMNGGVLAVKSDMALGKVLAARGMHAWMQTICEYLAYLCIFLLNYAGLVLLVGAGVGFIPDHLEITLNFEEIVHCAASILPVLVCISALQYLLYSLVESLISGLLLNFLGAMILAYLSGCFYPLNYLPAVMQRIAVFLPTEISMEYIAACFQENSLLINFVKLFLYTVLFIIVAAIVKKYRIRHE